MSSVRGGGYRGRGRGSPQSSPARGRGSSMRGRTVHSSNISSDNAQRGSASGSILRGTFGQPSQASNRPSGASSTFNRRNVRPSPPAQPRAFGSAKTRGSWQERYQTLTRAREQERSDAIRHGLIADPDKPRSLSEAITPAGTCQEMCAEYERVQRVVQKDVWDEETVTNQSPFSNTEKAPDEARMVKKFRRAAAGLEEQLPSDLRPPHVLKRTCDYLFDEVIGKAPSLAQVHHFVWDRTRAIRNDFSIQQVSKPDELRIAIDCYERIARFHILSLHQLALPEKPYSKYDWQQEREQLDRTLLSLMQYYDDSHGRIDIPNEAEFRAYCVVFQLQDPTPDLEDRVQTWPKRIIQDRRVKTATELYMAACNVMDSQGPLKPRANHLIARQDWQRFWTLIASKEVSYLMACVAEIYFNLVRRMVLNALFRTFRMNSNLATPDWTVDTLCELLAFDDGDEVYIYCERFGFSFKEREDGQQYLDLTSVRGRTLPEPSAGMPKQTKSALVEDKRFGRTLPAVINGLAVKQAQDMGLITEDAEDNNDMEDVTGREDLDLESADDITIEKDENLEDEDSLFVPAAKSEPKLQNQGLSPFASGATAGPSSIFNGGFSGSSTFGKPSAFGDPPKGFPSDQDATKDHTPKFSAAISAPKFDFTKAINGGAVTSSAPSPMPLFNFTSKSDASTEEPKEPKTFSFDQKTQSQSSIFDTISTPIQKPPTLTFTPTNDSTVTKDGPKQDDSNNIPSSNPFASSMFKPNSPSSEQSTPHFTFAQTPAAPAPLFPGPAKPPTEPKAVQQQQVPSASTSSPTATNNQTPSSTSLGGGAKRSSFSTDTRPKKPSPLSNSITATDNSSAVASKEPEFAGGRRRRAQPTTDAQEKEAAEQAAAAEFESLITRLAEELVHNAHDGLLKQYIDFIVGKTITTVQDQVATEKNNKEADDYRQFRLCEKYGARWRDVFWQRRLAKAGRDRRQRRQRRLQERGSAENDSLYSSPSVHSTGKARSAFDLGARDLDSKVQMGTSTSKPAFSQVTVARPLTNDRQDAPGGKRPMSSHGVNPAIPLRELGHKRLKSTSHVDDRNRIVKPATASHPSRDILQRSSFLSYSLANDTNADSHKNTTKSNYFRLKAMGVNRADSTVGRLLRGTKRPYSESAQHSFQVSSPPPALRSPSRLDITPKPSSSKAIALPPSSAPPTPSKANADDEALFARLRAAREGLKQSVSLFQSETVKDPALASSLGSQSSSESPSMNHARIQARLRASHAGSESGRSGLERSVPAYRLRESKFVPREHYVKAIEKANEIRASRSRDTSRPESRAESDGFGQNISQPSQNTGLSRHEGAVSTAGSSGWAKKTNGFPQTSAFPGETQAFQSTAQPSAFQSSAPISFSNHTTQMSSENPFLQKQIPDPLASFASQPPFGFENGVPADDNSTPQDHTIEPSFIDESLARSFGDASRYGPETFQVTPYYSQPQPQQDSYLASQGLSLLSDDVAEAQDPSPIDPRFYMGTEMDEANEELVDHATEDEGLQRWDVHAGSYAVRSQDADDEEANVQGWDSDDASGEDESREDEEPGYYGASHGRLNGYNGENEDEEEEEGLDGDIGEDETDDSEEDAEAEEDRYAQLPTDPWQRPAFAESDAWSARPDKNAALQDIGNTAEEAIELSD